MTTRRKDKPRQIDLTDELFGEIEEAQGGAYFSDGEQQPTMDAYWERIRGRREWARRVVRIYTDFLRKYGQSLPPKGKAGK